MGSPKPTFIIVLRPKLPPAALHAAPHAGNAPCARKPARNRLTLHP
jgi:hypothetical protein